MDPVDPVDPVIIDPVKKDGVWMLSPRRRRWLGWDMRSEGWRQNTMQMFRGWLERI